MPCSAHQMPERDVSNEQELQTYSVKHKLHRGCIVHVVLDCRKALVGTGLDQSLHRDM